MSLTFEVDKRGTEKLNEWVRVLTEVQAAEVKLAEIGWRARFLGVTVCRSEASAEFIPYDNQLVQVTVLGDRPLDMFDFEEVPRGQYFPKTNEFPYGEPAGRLPTNCSFRASTLHAWSRVYQGAVGSGHDLLLCAHTKPHDPRSQKVTGVFVHDDAIMETDFSIVRMRPSIP